MLPEFFATFMVKLYFGQRVKKQRQQNVVKGLHSAGFQSAVSNNCAYLFGIWFSANSFI